MNLCQWWKGKWDDRKDLAEGLLWFIVAIVRRDYWLELMFENWFSNQKSTSRYLMHIRCMYTLHTSLVCLRLRVHTHWKVLKQKFNAHNRHYSAHCTGVCVGKENINGVFIFYMHRWDHTLTSHVILMFLLGLSHWVLSIIDKLKFLGGSGAVRPECRIVGIIAIATVAPLSCQH